MPKFMPNYNEWYIKKNCGYCGKLFYPVQDNEEFCDYRCKEYWKDYIETIEAMWMDEWSDYSYTKDDF